MSKILLIAAGLGLSGLLAFSHPARADGLDISSLLESIPQSIGNDLDNLNISFSSTLLNSDIFKGLNVGVDYSYNEMPAYRDSLFTRVDEWQTQSTISPVDWFRAVGSPVYLQIQPGTQIIFVRQFPTQSQAILAAPKVINPFSLKDIPVTAQSAIDNLKPGDAVMLPVTLNLLLGAQAVQNLGIFQLNEPAQLIVAGQYEIAVVRLADNHVRMRIIALKSRQAVVQPSAQIENVSVYKLNVLNHALEEIVGKNLLSATASKSNGELFMLDYMFDLNEPDARKAYDSVFASNFTLRALTQLEHSSDITNDNVTVISDLSLADKLFTEDARKPIEQRRVAQILQASDDYSEKSADFQSGFHLLGFDLGTSVTTHDVTFYDSNNKKASYLLPIYRKTNEWEAIWNLFHHSRVYTGSTLYNLPDSRQQAQSPSFADEIITLEVKDNTLSTSARKGLRQTLSLMISPEILNQVDLSMWDTKDTLLESRLFAQVIFRPEALAALAGFSRQQLQDGLYAYLRANGLKSLIPQLVTEAAWNPDEGGFTDEKQVMTNSKTTEFLDDLSYLVDPSHDVKSRMDRFAKVRTNKVFVKAGCGFIMNLLKSRDLKQMVYVQIQLDARDKTPVRFSYGDPVSDQVYAAMEYIQNVIDNGAYDLRLQTFDAPFAL